MASTQYPTFGTQEWADQLKTFLNKNPNYKDSAKTWEGAFILEFIAEGKKLKQDTWVWLDLWHGECRDAKFLMKRDEIQAPFYLSAKETAWDGVVKGTINPQTALVGGKFKLTGEMAKMMRFPKAAAYILKYLTRLLKDW
jgi:putative sterol carrier protein